MIHAAPDLLAQPVWSLSQPCQDEGARNESWPLCPVFPSPQSSTTNKGKHNLKRCQMTMHVRKQVYRLSDWSAPACLSPSLERKEKFSATCYMRWLFIAPSPPHNVTYEATNAHFQHRRKRGRWWLTKVKVPCSLGRLSFWWWIDLLPYLK